MNVLLQHLQIQQADFFIVVDENCPPGLSQAKLQWCLHMLNACFPLLDWYLVSKQSCWAGDVLHVDTSSTRRASVPQLGLKQHAERCFTSPGCSVPTLLDSTLCVWVTVFNLQQRRLKCIDQKCKNRLSRWLYLLIYLDLLCEQTQHTPRNIG